MFPSAPQIVIAYYRAELLFKTRPKIWSQVEAIRTWKLIRAKSFDWTRLSDHERNIVLDALYSEALC